MKRLLKFYKRNKAISNIGIVALAISFSYAILYNVPDYLGIEAYYSLLNNICISYIAALIFFVVQVYIPEERNQKKCIEILKNQFADFTRFNEIAVLFCEKHISINKKGATIHWNGEKEKIYLKLKSSDESKGIVLEKHTKAELLNWGNMFNEKLRKIKDATVIKYCDYEILEKLSELEKANFYMNLAVVIKYADTDIGLQDVNDSIKEFKRMNDELKRMCSICRQYELLDVTKDDILQIDTIYKNLLNNTFNIQSHNREIVRANIEDQLNKQGLQFSNQDIEALCNIVLRDVQTK